MSSLKRISQGILKERNIKLLSRSLYSFKDNPKMKKMKETQAFFQRDDGVPVYLKGGTKDKILYRATLGLMGIGLIMVVQFVFQNIKKI